jgi:metallo-beta-lactamase family protein
MLKDLYEDGTLKNIPVYVDSPLAKNVTEVFRDHPECFDEETYKIFANSDPFDFPNLKYIKNSDESKTLNKKQGPMIIMSASGMCEGGRVTHHLIHGIEQEKNIIVITGFQARGTLGRKILEGADKVWIFNDEYKVRAKVYFMGGLSAHADGQDLKNYAGQCNGGRLEKIFLIHGDLDEARALRKYLLASQDVDVSIPQTLTRVSI